jgi:hypothetical protein
MTSSDKKKTGILGLLLIVAGVAWYFFVYRPTLIPAADAAQVAAKAKTIKHLGNAQIVWPDPPANLNVGQKNLFTYREVPVPPKPAAPSSDVFRPAQPPPGPSTEIRPTVPQPPPFKAFKYDGFSMPKNGKPLASLSEGGITYQAKEGDCVLGQYCITRITENVIEIQDIQLKRSQTITRSTQ